MAQEIEVKSDETSLLAECINGSQGAWDIFVKQYSKVIYYSIIKTFNSYKKSFQQEDVEDLFNSIFLSLIENNYKRLRQFEPGRGCTLSSWIRLISMRRSIDFLRMQRPHVSIHDEKTSCQLAKTINQNQMSIIDQIEQKEAENLMKEAMEALPSSDKLFIEFYYEKELAPEQIADIMNVSVNTIYSKKNRIREKIKKILRDKGYIARNSV